MNEGLISTVKLNAPTMIPPPPSCAVEFDGRCVRNTINGKVANTFIKLPPSDKFIILNFLFDNQRGVQRIQDSNMPCSISPI